MPVLFTHRTVGKRAPLAGEYDGFPVTPSDSADLPNSTAIGLVALGAGNIAVQTPSGATATITIGAGVVGQPVIIEVSRVLAAGTTATGIHALYANY